MTATGRIPSIRSLQTFVYVTFVVLFLAACTSDRVTAIQNVNLVPMTAEVVTANQTVLVKGGKIFAISTSDRIDIPRRAIRIDGSGAFLMPGLADMHMHTRDDWLSPAWPVSPFHLYLANGVTTIRCFGPMGKSPDYILDWRNAINAGRLDGPTVITCGPILLGAVNDVQKFVRDQKTGGFDFLKIYSYVSRNEFKTAMHTAKRIGFYTAGHIPFSVGLDGVLSAGMDEIAHIEELDFEFLDFDENDFHRVEKQGRTALFRHILAAAVEQYKSSMDIDMERLEEKLEKPLSAIVAKLKAANVPVCTTLAVGDGIVKKLHQTDQFLKRLENRFMCRGYMDGFRKGEEKHLLIFKGYEDFASLKYRLERLLLVKLKDAGIPLLLATDAGTGRMGIVPGFSIHDELRILTENGFSPYEAIATGTANAAKVVQKMTGTDDFGTIEIGKRADLLLIDDNPLEDISNIKRMRGVMAQGRWYPQEKLNEMIQLN